jgi:DNA-binding response OmpR family regulator
MKTDSDAKTVLLVDDDIDFLTQHKLLLEKAGFTVLSAQGQKQAEEILQTARCDLAIVDLMMEHTDGGFALCYHIKKKDPTVPVILVTGVTHEAGMDFDTTTEEERSWVKADAMLTKPFRFEQLQREIARVMEK